MDIQTYVDQHGITVERTGFDEGWRQDDEGWDHYAMRVRLRNAKTKRQVTLPWRQGTAHGTATPTAAEVFNSLIMDATFYEDCETVQAFADELGYDFDTYQEKRRVSKMYTACKQAHEKVIRFVDGQDEYTWIRQNVDAL